MYVTVNATVVSVISARENRLLVIKNNDILARVRRHSATFTCRYLFRVALLQDRLAAASRHREEAPPADPVLAHLPLQTVQPIEE